MRKLVGSLLLLAWLVAYIAVAAIAWVLPLKPLIRWIHSKDEPRESPDV